MTRPDEPTTPLQCFFNEWAKSRVGSHHHFCNHWMINLHEHLDSYGQLTLTTLPLSLYHRKLRYFHWEIHARGTHLANQLSAFDRVAGYSFAWYFHWITGTLISPSIPFSVRQDLEEGYRYLAEPDRVILETWLKELYKIQ